MSDSIELTEVVPKTAGSNVTGYKSVDGSGNAKSAKMSNRQEMAGDLDSGEDSFLDTACRDKEDGNLFPLLLLLNDSKTVFSFISS